MKYKPANTKRKLFMGKYKIVCHYKQKFLRVICGLVISRIKHDVNIGGGFPNS